MSTPPVERGTGTVPGLAPEDEKRIERDALDAVLNAIGEKLGELERRIEALEASQR